MCNSKSELTNHWNLFCLLVENTINTECPFKIPVYNAVCRSSVFLEVSSLMKPFPWTCYTTVSFTVHVSAHSICAALHSTGTRHTCMYIAYYRWMLVTGIVCIHACMYNVHASWIMNIGSFELLSSHMLEYVTWEWISDCMMMTSMLMEYF